MISQAVLQDFLVMATGLDKKFIVPKQGTWWNPQDQSPLKTTWIAYLLKDAQPKTRRRRIFLAGVEYLTQVYISDVDLQIVGKKAESLAQSVAMWPDRGDLVWYLQKNAAEFVLPRTGNVIVSNFFQGGQNNSLAYNVGVGLCYTLFIKLDQTKLEKVEWTDTFLVS